ncbi:hypothetical protein LJB77_01075 [Ruminococcaceae bacterium OttesenSCG-928-N02]|nr:hypothetical protein [Ruminococcaceae bacterium OttesenSCG-928-N02]
MKPLEQTFQEAVLAKVANAATLGVKPGPAFFTNVQKFGALAMCQRAIARGQTLPMFDALCKAGHPAATLEEIVVQRKFAPLFTDEEVNACFDALVDAGLYT